MTVFSIIIPVKSINDYVRETIPYILALDRGDWELFIVTNQQEESEWIDERIHLMSSGKVGPGIKRDMAAKVSKGEYLVFLDDDSYPDSKLLSIAVENFTDQIIALGGPAITPSGDDFWQKVSGAVFLSKFSGGSPERYVPNGKKRFIDDWPSVNLMVRRDKFLEIGGFNSQYWPGEDTKLCHDLTKAGGRILYDPSMIVWHHRRVGLGNHLRQIGGYGLHRGFFAKRFPATSCKLKYFAPTILLIFGLFSLVVGFFSPLLLPIVFIGYGFYVLILITAYIEIRKYEEPLISLAALYYTVFTHHWYGFKFLQGLFTRDLTSKLR